MKIKEKGRNLLVNLMLLAISGIIALLLSEIACRALGFEPMYVSPERDRFWKYDSLLGWAHDPGQEGIFEASQFRTSLRINQGGLRDRDHPYERVDNSRRILVLGDSFAWGYGVEESERFSEVLEVSLGAEVINAGVSGYSTDQELLWLKSEGHKYAFDLIVLVFAGNDIGDNHKDIVNTIYYKPYFTAENGELVLKGTPVPRASLAAKAVYFASQRSALAFLLVRQFIDLRAQYADRDAGAHATEGAVAAKATETSAPITSTAFDLTVDLLTEMENEAHARSAQFLIVATDGWWNAPPGVSYESFIEILERQGFLILDVTTAAGFDPEQMSIPGDGHWNAAGHGFVAQKVKELIESRQLLGAPQTQ